MGLLLNLITCICYILTSAHPMKIMFSQNYNDYNYYQYNAGMMNYERWILMLYMYDMMISLSLSLTILIGHNVDPEDVGPGLSDGEWVIHKDEDYIGLSAPACFFLKSKWSATVAAVQACSNILWYSLRFLIILPVILSLCSMEWLLYLEIKSFKYFCFLGLRMK